MTNRHWLWPAVVTTLIILLIAGGVVWTLTRDTEKLAGLTIPVNAEVTLRHMATLTDKDTKITMNEPTWRDKVVSKIPGQLRARFFPSYQFRTPYEVLYSKMGPGDFRMLFRVDYPKSWLPVSNRGDLDQKLEAALEDAELQQYRAVLGRSFITHLNNIDFSQGPSVHINGKIREAKPFVTLMVHDAPIYARHLELQFFSDWDESSTVTNSVKVPNPYWEKISPLPEPEPLPQKDTDGDLEVTLCQLVSRVNKNYYVDFRTSGGEEVMVSRAVEMALPVSAPLPPEFFPEDDSQDYKSYYSLAVFAVNQKGQAEPEWRISDVDIFYGQKLHELAISSWSSKGTPAAYFARFSADLSAVAQPVKVVATLSRDKNFPADELRTVTAPLPKEGQSTSSLTKAVLWNDEVTVSQVAYKVAGSTTEPITTKADSLSVILRSESSRSRLQDAFLIKDDGSTASLQYTETSSMSSDKTSVNHYDLSRKPSWPRDAKPLVYEDYTSIGLTFKSPRDYPKKFEIYARPVEAKGKWERGRKK